MTFEKSGTKIEENVMWHEGGNKGCIKLIKHKRINPLVKIIPIIFPPLVIPISLSLSSFSFSPLSSESSILHTRNRCSMLNSSLHLERNYRWLLSRVDKQIAIPIAGSHKPE